MCITEYIMQILIIITDNIYIYIYSRVISVVKTLLKKYAVKGLEKDETKLDDELLAGLLEDALQNLE